MTKEKMVHTFEQNILYFEENQKKVFEKLSALESAIEQNLYQNRYELINKENYFEVIESLNNKILYNSDSFAYAKTVSKSISFKKNENVFETFKIFPLEDESGYLIDVASTLQYIKSHMPREQEFKRINKFVFFGVGLGTHINEVHEKIKAQNYFIIEDDLELFKLSLFVTPYYEIAKKSQLFFSVFESNEEFVFPAQAFINNNFFLNHYIKFFHMLSHSEEKIKEFHVRVVSQSQNVFFYKDILTQYLAPLKFMSEKYNFLNILDSYENTSLTNKPVLLLAAGPSLKKNMEWLKNNQERFFIVALSSVLNTIEKEGIIPDVVTHMDGFETSATHFTKLKSLDFLKQTIFFLSARTPDSIVKMLNKEHVFFYENGTSYKQGIGNLSAACVGSTTYLLLLGLRVRELYLLGLDLALDSQTGATHSEGHEYVQTLDLENSNRHDDVMEFKNSVIKVDGNFEPQVYTTPEYALSIESINAASQWFKKEDLHIYNLSSGAKFLSTTAKNIESVETNLLQLIDKNILASELKTIFTKNCSNEITELEISVLHQRLNYALELKNVIISQQFYHFETSDEFLHSLVNIFYKLSNDTSPTAYDLSLIFQEYCKFMYTFIFDFFNTKGLLNEDKTAQDINEMFTKALMRMINEYIDSLKVVLNLS
ncbi:MAG: DUF115 domain-containing protein [Campylobacterales bacterium]|nr:DUF115 domain-containing protein [Campylobacterales bacterium]